MHPGVELFKQTSSKTHTQKDRERERDRGEKERERGRERERHTHTRDTDTDSLLESRQDHLHRYFALLVRSVSALISGRFDAQCDATSAKPSF